ncbi:amino acid permease-domain-containing protein [Dactylonectria macrodidyma]|uniref:Amino acid permease-domain-containing protein n=1 Tax=Dactylonectria macrodidyma TaxID=307937 RepID=A0A9P9II93_9HYPO|nr:amino acid permease-domain-containing protein [Dactylonectria macrodidyma]
MQHKLGPWTERKRQTLSCHCFCPCPCHCRRRESEPSLTRSLAAMAYQREIEMQVMPQSKPVILIKNSFAVNIDDGPKRAETEHEQKPTGPFDRLMHSFRRTSSRFDDDYSMGSRTNTSTTFTNHGRFFNVKRANLKSANTLLARELKNRHLQMIAFGGSIGTGLFVASGVALYRGGPASLLMAFIITGIMQFFTMQALGELSVAFPVGGSFSNYSTRFLDPSWGFAMGWNYALQYLVVLPLEIIAGSLTTTYWNSDLSKAIFVALFLILIVSINLLGVRGYGEAEFIFSTIKVTAVLGFILLGIIINIMGHPDSGYIGFQYWRNPGAFHHGFKGFASVLVTATFSYAGTEMVGLAAAETASPRKSLPAAVKQVFWRISIFYITSILLIGLLVPYNEPRLLGAKYGADAAASPFVIAIESSGQTVLPSVMNGVILVALISVGNTAVYASSRTLAALAEQSLAPQIFAYIDRRGRPLIAILFASFIGLLAFLADADIHTEIFNWLLALSGLSTLFTWASICLCHIRFRKAWRLSGHSLSQLAFRSQVGVVGSWIALGAYGMVLVLQIWVASSPIMISDTPLTTSERVKAFFMQVLTVPIIFMFYIGHKLRCRTKIVRDKDIDVDTGRKYLQVWNTEDEEARKSWPLWKRIYNTMC